MPAFLVPVIAWIAKWLEDRAFAISVAAFFITTAVAAVVAVCAFAATVSPSIPDSVSQALSFLAPRDAAAQVALVVAAKATAMSSKLFMKSIEIGGQAK